MQIQVSVREKSLKPDTVLFSMSYVRADSYGVVNKSSGEYDGIYGVLQRDEADMAIVPMPFALGIDPRYDSPMLVGAAQHQWDTVIASHEVTFKEQKVFVDDSLLAFKANVVLLFVVLSLLIVVLLVFHRRMKASGAILNLGWYFSWNLISQLFEQHCVEFMYCWFSGKVRLL